LAHGRAGKAPIQRELVLPPPAVPIIRVIPRPPAEHVVDAVVCTAAEAICRCRERHRAGCDPDQQGVTPAVNRPAVRDAFRSAHLASLSLDEVEAALDRKLAPAGAPR